jgi:hypothetical protein
VSWSIWGSWLSLLMLCPYVYRISSQFLRVCGLFFVAAAAVLFSEIHACIIFTSHACSVATSRSPSDVTQRSSVKVHLFFFIISRTLLARRIGEEDKMSLSNNSTANDVWDELTDPEIVYKKYTIIDFVIGK